MTPAKPHRGGRRPTFDAAEAERRWHSGRYATIAEIARSLDVSSTTVGIALNRRGIYGSPGGQAQRIIGRRLPDADAARIAELAREGWTRVEVQAEMGLSHVTVGKYWPADVKRLPRARLDSCNERSQAEQAVMDRDSANRLLQALVAAGMPPLASLEVGR